MTWFKVDDGFYDNPDVEMLPDAAVALWTRAGSYCGKHLTDGVISGRVARRFCDDPDKGILALVAAGLWEALNEAGNVITGAITGASRYRFRNWEKYQPTKEAAILEREKKAEAARAGNHDRWHIDRNEYSEDCAYCVAGTGRTRPRWSDRASDDTSDDTSDRSRESARPTRPLRTTTTRSAKGAEQKLPPADPATLFDAKDPAPTGVMIAGWLERTPRRPSKSTIGKVGKVLRDAIVEREVPIPVVGAVFDEWIASGKFPGSLEPMIDNAINRAARPANHRRSRCPIHRSYWSDSCPRPHPEELHEPASPDPAQP